jgi:hypothetical protein
MLNEAECGAFIPAKDVSALVKAVREFEQLPQDELGAIGKRGKEWLLKNRPYEKLAIDYCRHF